MLGLIAATLGFSRMASAPALAALRVQPAAQPATADPALSARVVKNLAKLPLSFEANRGQADRQVKFLSRGQGYEVLLTPTEAVLGLRVADKRDDAKSRFEKIGLKANSKAPQFAMLGMRLNGANPQARTEGEGQMALKSNYLIGNDRSKWLRHIPNYKEVKFAEVYPGIDLVYHGSDQGRLEYDFVVKPGADPSKIEIAFDGTQGLKLNDKGDLSIQTAGGELIEHAPVIYQREGGQRRTIGGGYVMRGKDRVSFKLASYDRSRAIVIDPFIVYSTFLGGSASDIGFGIAVQPGTGPEDAYVTGETCSTDFAVTGERFQGLLKGLCNAFVTKLDQIGSSAIYSTYLGGSKNSSGIVGTSVDEGFAIAVDTNRQAHITGQTNAVDFPTSSNAFQSTIGGTAFNDAFVSVLDQDGDELLYSTYLGGSSDDGADGIVLDSSNNTYVTGGTCSTNFPTTTGVPQPTNAAGNCQPFVTKINASGTSLGYSTYLGGTTAGGSGSAIALDSQRNAYVTGTEQGTDFPTFPRTGPETAYQTTSRGGENAFVVKYNPTGTAVIYSTLLGGSDADEGLGIAVDSAGNAYVAGSASSSDFVVGVVPGSFQTKPSPAGFSSAFVAKLDSDGDALLYFSYLGGSSSDSAFGLALDSLNNAWITGRTCSTNFPTTPGAFQPVSPGPCDAFIAKFDSGGNLVSSSYLGGSSFDEGNAVAVDASCNAFVTGDTDSADFPHGPFVFDPTYDGNGDAFATRIAQWTLTGRGTAISVTGVGITGDTGNVSTVSSTNRTALFATLDTGLVQANLLEGQVITDACAGRSTADAEAATVILRLPNAPIIIAKAVEGTSTTTCQGSTGTMNVASIQVGNMPPSGGGFPPNTKIPLGPATLILNEQVPITGTEKGLLVNAIDLKDGAFSAIVASAKSDIGNCPACPTGDTLCPVSGSPPLFSQCKDLKTDPTNCGTCGNVCGSTVPVCSAGVCVP